MPPTRRGDHPDLVPETGDLRDDAFLPPAKRDFNRTMADPTQRERFMQNVARWQSQLPEEIQRDVQGRTFGTDPYDGYVQYKQAVAEARSLWRGNELTSDDISRMSLEEFDRAFDETGKPREGFTFRPTGRDVVTDAEAGVDRYSRDELNRRRGQEG